MNRQVVACRQSVLIFVVSFVVWRAIPARADVALPPVFSNGMVLQQGMKAPVWGKADNGEKVTVKFREHLVSATADSNSNWRVDLPAMQAGGPWPMTLEGRNKIEFKEVYVGEVWLASGQSNMRFMLNLCTGGREAARKPVPNLRLLEFNENGKVYGWYGAGDTNGLTAQFGGVPYWFGAALLEARKTPVGIIQTAIGATFIEEWMSVERLHAAGYSFDKRAGGWWKKHMEPVVPYALKGFIWYQGEWNASYGFSPGKYVKLTETLVNSWRDAWGNKDLPFLYVQLPRNDMPHRWKSQALAEEPWVLFRDDQLKCLQAAPHCAMVVSFDTADGTLHPPGKKEVGERLALAARALAYGEKVEFSGPLFKDGKRTDNKLIISFDHVGGGLQAGRDGKDSELKDFFLIYPRPANARYGPSKPVKAGIEGETVVVDLTDAGDAVAVTYANDPYMVGNLYNKNGLPASPFRVNLQEKKAADKGAQK